MSVQQSHPPVTARPAARADDLCFRSFCGSATAWEVPDDGPVGLLTIFEQCARIVAISSASVRDVAPIEWNAQPLPALDPLVMDGPKTALVGRGLWIGSDVTRETCVTIHRLARSLRADELGARYAILRAPIPDHPRFDARGVVQQLVAGSIHFPPITVPLEEGYWPAAITPANDVVLVRENRTF